MVFQFWDGYLLLLFRMVILPRGFNSGNIIVCEIAKGIRFRGD